ncbi:hypothetical protein GR212_15360 [Rhizobium lusitanum]|uniref:Phage gp6-like head-tail connector protein n=1 Tax=Rhizobium lusitanum TaxID=293958 RepID=A0A6L9U650_9HYPH|nr:hypothetical protein [Rhizobium lusitanum]NEI70961.1 hypothetical protein [Rhizobium lusitanum]
MLDIEIVTPPTKTALDIVSVAEFARHLHLSSTLRNNADWVANMSDALKEAVDKIHGLSGELNRMVLPCTLKRYLSSFPADGRPIQLPYPDLISLDAITIEDGSSPPNNLDPAAYIVTDSLVPEVYAVQGWPPLPARPRGVSVTYQAGYTQFPLNIKRYVKILAAHMMENPEATIMEPRQMQINRKVEFGIDSLRAALRIPVSYDDWL